MNRILLFMLAGGLFGIGINLARYNVPPYQVHLEESLPFLVFGSLIGSLIGYLVLRLISHKSIGDQFAGKVAVVVLVVSIMVNFGWIAGTIVANIQLPHVDVADDVQYLPPLGMMTGGGVGCILGLLVCRSRTATDSESR